MRIYSLLAKGAIGLALLCAPSISTTEAFHQPAFAPRGGRQATFLSSIATSVIIEVPTKPIPGMRPGTSGLRKKVEIWQGLDEANRNYVENFIQSLIDTATAANDGKILDT